MSTDAPWKSGEWRIPREESVIKSFMEIVASMGVLGFSVTKCATK